eukprot:TRINITY_DN6588_c0_g1_i9.p1 TRINITY_DN6588_c0_g1~~TRINITY_DN6588_c0_g1_i9.p1  ORF type:complete len:417 (-),score=41.21 TRINITY_DN6588_c0_g1_i9:64-1314(-)
MPSSSPAAANSSGDPTAEQLAAVRANALALLQKLTDLLKTNQIRYDWLEAVIYSLRQMLNSLYAIGYGIPAASSAVASGNAPPAAAAANAASTASSLTNKSPENGNSSSNNDNLVTFWELLPRFYAELSLMENWSVGSFSYSSATVLYGAYDEKDAENKRQGERTKLVNSLPLVPAISVPAERYTRVFDYVSFDSYHCVIVNSDLIASTLSSLPSALNRVSSFSTLLLKSGRFMKPILPEKERGKEIKDPRDEKEKSRDLERESEAVRYRLLLRRAFYSTCSRIRTILRKSRNACRAFAAPAASLSSNQTDAFASVFSQAQSRQSTDERLVDDATWSQSHAHLGSISPIVEYGMKLTLHPSDPLLAASPAIASSFNFPFWVVGRVCSSDQEFFVCYHDSAPQSVVDLAFRYAVTMS